MRSYDDQVNELSVAEYDMIWSLFYTDNVENPDECKNCEAQPGGVGVRLLRFLFGGGHDPPNDNCAKYDERRPYHSHVYQPVTRTRPNTHIGPDGTPWRGDPAPESSLIPAPYLNSMVDEASHSRLFCQEVIVSTTIVAVAILLMAARSVVLPSFSIFCAPSAPATSRSRPAEDDPEDSDDHDTIGD